MRRISGVYDGIEYIVIEHMQGQIECSPLLRPLLTASDGTMPEGEALLSQCRVLFGDTLHVREGD